MLHNPEKHFRTPKEKSYASKGEAVNAICDRLFEIRWKLSVHQTMADALISDIPPMIQQAMKDGYFASQKEALRYPEIRQKIKMITDQMTVDLERLKAAYLP